jgi:ABC-2 type transport system permease protein
VRPFFWSVRRELWEHPSIYLVPAIVGIVVVTGVLIMALRGPIGGMGPVELRAGGDVIRLSGRPAMGSVMLVQLLVAAAAIALVGALTGLFYCLAALSGERRDRSILFWKSLPVSNLTTVASKVVLPMVILPAVVFMAAVATHLADLAILAGNLLGRGQTLDVLAELPLPRLWLLLAWALFTAWLWWAPVFGWALLVSAWARRLTLLWAVLPPIGLAVFERVAFDTQHVESILRNRLVAFPRVAFKGPSGFQHSYPNMILSDPDPAGFFANPGLWIGLAVAALCFAGAVWLRRRAEPV